MVKKERDIADKELVEMRARCDAATVGPWKSFIEGQDHVSGSNFVRTSGGARAPDIELSGATDADQDFIAAARDDVPRLINEVMRLRRRLKKLEKVD